MLNSYLHRIILYRIHQHFIIYLSLIYHLYDCIMILLFLINLLSLIHYHLIYKQVIMKKDNAIILNEINVYQLHLYPFQICFLFLLHLEIFFLLQNIQYFKSNLFNFLCILTYHKLSNLYLIVMLTKITFNKIYIH